MNNFFSWDNTTLYALNPSQANNTAAIAQTDQIGSGSEFGWNRLHRYLGYGSLLLTAIAAVSSTDRSVHYGSAYAATGAALATCYTGYKAYGDRFDLANGLFSEDNTHILLGVLGTIGVATAVAIGNSSRSTHAKIGGAGGAAMLFSIITIRW